MGEDNLNGEASTKEKFDSSDLRVLGDSIKESGRNIREISWQYKSLRAPERQVFVEQIDSFIAALNRTWKLMRQDILDDN